MEIKKVLVITVLFMSLTIALQAQGRDDNALNKVLAHMGLTLSVPEGFKEIPKVPQGETGVYYDKGYKSNIMDFEVRFFVMPIEDMSERNPVGFFRDFLKTIIVNLTQNGYYILHNDYIKSFPNAAVREDFGGDLGYYCLVTGQSDFMKGYNWVNITVVYKQGKGLFMIFQLFSDKEILMRNKAVFDSSFYILRFAHDEGSSG